MQQGLFAQISGPPWIWKSSVIEMAFDTTFTVVERTRL